MNIDNNVLGESPENEEFHDVIMIIIHNTFRE